ncbi:MAG: glutamate-1-semialdehyde 2,1-aminomutase [Parachlamydiales bacterium]|nr:glutamate-1-semialdehyde 2,1-aminomutase [Parachlamydiales bacterium]
MNRHQSAVIYHQLCELIPGGVNSPARAFKDVSLPPVVVQSSCQDTICDVDHNTYIDFCCSWGAIIHGHANSVINNAVKSRIEKGTSFGMTTEVEALLAAKISKFIPSMQKMRFVSSGTEATMSAIRLARGITGRDYIVKFTGNYHGHADSFLVQAGSAAWGLNATASSSGVPQAVAALTICLPYNDEQLLKNCFEDFGDKIAAVIVEPVAANMGVVPASPSFLKLLRKVTADSSSLLIFDEVITGFRVAKGGAQELCGIVPDLTCLGKVIGGGFPVAAFGGKKEWMEHLAPLGSVFQAGTLSGNPVAMSAGLAALELLEVPGFYDRLEEKTNRLINPIYNLISELKEPVCLRHLPGLFTLFFGIGSVEHAGDLHMMDRNRFSDFFAFLLENGVLAPPSPYEAWFLTSAHTDEHLDYTSQLICRYLKEKCC